MRARQQKANYELTLGAALGAALRSGCRVRQGGLGPTPADTVGSSSMTITAALALFAALWASVLKRKESRLEQVRYKI